VGVHAREELEKRPIETGVGGNRQHARVVAELDAAHFGNRDLYRRVNHVIQHGNHGAGAHELCAEIVQTRHAPQIVGHVFSSNAEVSLGFPQHRHIDQRQNNSRGRLAVGTIRHHPQTVVPAVLRAHVLAQRGQGPEDGAGLLRQIDIA
jgi:hypothetical protein